MRFSLSSSALSSRLLSLSRVINNKNSLPILSCFLFQVKDNVLTITASDSENVMKTTIELTEHDGDGEFAVQSQTILDAVKELPEQPLTLNVNLDEHVIYLTYQNGSYHSPCRVPRSIRASRRWARTPRSLPSTPRCSPAPSADPFSLRRRMSFAP